MVENMERDFQTMTISERSNIMAPKDPDSFVRWQEVTINHFSVVSNVILSLATGLLAFFSTLLLDHKLSTGCVFHLSIA
jgi:hypothetical protein